MKGRFLIPGALVVITLLLAVFAVGHAWPGETYAQECTELTNNMVIIQDTTFCPKTYSFRDREEDGVVIIGADNIIVDGNGLSLDGKNKSGYGIYLDGYNGVTLRNFIITRYHDAIRVENANSILVENNKLSNNGGKTEQFYDINRPLPSAYGGGILVNATTNSTFQDNVGSGQNVGIDVYGSSGNTISNNDFSDNFGWGVRLFASTLNTVSSNRADHVHGCRGAFCSARDTAGMLLVMGSHDNTISGNSITDGGDGFFIGNENGGPSNNNLIENNDARFAIHNAFEATFSEGNIFRGNIASDSDYGFWLGFSHHSTVENNTINNNRTDGIHWEHGRFGTITGNEMTGNGRYALALTRPRGSEDPLVKANLGSEASHDYAISGNTLADNGQYGVYLLHTTDSTIQSNTVAGNNINLYFDGDSINNIASQNDLLCGSPSGNTCQYSAFNNMDVGKDVNAENNWWGTNVESEIDALVFDNRDDSTKGLINFAFWLDASSNTAPTASDVSTSIKEDSSVTVTLTATDPEECELTFSIVDPPANGILTGITNDTCTAGTPDADSATVTYTPNADFNGTDSFTYKTNDGTSDSNIAAVSITVNAVNDAPVADDQAVSTTKDTAVDITLTGSDVDNCELAFAIDTNPTSGTLSATTDNACVAGNPNTDGASVTYTPNAGFTGTDSFTFKFNDGALDSNTATVSITVSEPSVGVTVAAIDPNAMPRRFTIDVTITGSGFASGASVTFENGECGKTPAATVNSVSGDGKTIGATVTSGNGPKNKNCAWDVRVTNPDGTAGVLVGGFTVTP